MGANISIGSTVQQYIMSCCTVFFNSTYLGFPALYSVYNVCALGYFIGYLYADIADIQHRNEVVTRCIYSSHILELLCLWYFILIFNAVYFKAVPVGTLSIMYTYLYMVAWSVRPIYLSIFY